MMNVPWSSQPTKYTVESKITKRAVWYRGKACYSCMEATVLNAAVTGSSPGLLILTALHVFSLSSPHFLTINFQIEATSATKKKIITSKGLTCHHKGQCF
ncbi:hypothetical protein ILYODFUR_039018 [Ilyodon furcidens]|uniref:Uncharacterized protein n=1 Tax=Ilyodon furcidens TaxID=33524 RepID=A0ABV0T3Y1_9TELE